MLDPQGRLVPRDMSEVEVWLAVHGESRSGRAWLVSRTGHKRDAMWLPKKLCDIREPNGGFQRMDHNCQRVLIPIHCVSMPKFKAVEKGLA